MARLVICPRPPHVGGTSLLLFTATAVLHRLQALWLLSPHPAVCWRRLSCTEVFRAHAGSQLAPVQV